MGKNIIAPDGTPALAGGTDQLPLPSRKVPALPFNVNVPTLPTPKLV